MACRKPVDAKKQILIDELKKAFSGRRSMAGSEVDGNEFSMEMTGPENKYLRSMQEKLEQLLYFEPDGVLLKQRMRALYVLNSRANLQSKYKNTPIEVLRAAKQYGSIPVAAYMSLKKDAPRHLVKLPRAKASFFKQAEELVYLKGSGSGATISNVRHVSHALFAQLLRLYFPKSNDFVLQKDEKSSQYYYESKKTIEFFSIHGGKLRKLRGRIHYAGGVGIVGVSPPLDGQLDLLFVGEATRRRLEKSGDAIRVKQGLRRYIKPKLDYDNPPRASTVEIDFDKDEVIDLLVSYESCPDEAGDSSDIVNAYNLNGKWVRQLMSRSWCYP